MRSLFVKYALHLEEWLFYIFIFAIPLQTRKILLQQDWVFSEWRSVSLYATDILILGLFVFWFFNSGAGKIKKKPSRSDYFLIAFLLAAFISIKNSTDVTISSYQWLKLAQFAALYWYIKTHAIKQIDRLCVAAALVIGGGFQAIIGIFQFILQADLGLRLLGESVLMPEMHGVAVFYNDAGQKIMRAYGTTPHPNILAAYLLFALFALYYLYLKLDEAEYFKKLPLAIYHLLFAIAYAVILTGFLLTFSRTSILVWLFGLVAATCVFFRKYGSLAGLRNQKFISIVIATAIISAAFIIFLWPDVASRLTISAGDESVSQRLFFNRQALEAGFHSGGLPNWLKFLDPVLMLNWTGIGIGNFVNWFMFHAPHLPTYLYQPAHNIYLLIYSETGIWGILAFLGFLGILIRNLAVRKPASLYDIGILMFWASLLFIGLFDHFPWTLQQGRILFWLVTGLTAALPQNPKT